MKKVNNYPIHRILLAVAAAVIFIVVTSNTFKEPVIGELTGLAIVGEKDAVPIEPLVIDVEEGNILIKDNVHLITITYDEQIIFNIDNDGIITGMDGRYIGQLNAKETELMREVFF